VSSLVVTWWYHTVVCGASLTVLVLTSPGSIWETSGSSWLLLAGIAAANFAGQLMLNYGFQRMEASIGSAVNTAQVLYSYVWDLTVLQHVVRPCAVAGSAAIVVGVVCAALGKRKGGSDAAEGEEEGGEGEGDDPEVTQRLLAS
jgi:drug/metabolite transporter (DMT)-like permease